jgi:hypothetical protein
MDTSRGNFIVMGLYECQGRSAMEERTRSSRGIAIFQFVKKGRLNFICFTVLGILVESCEVEVTSCRVECAKI